MYTLYTYTYIIYTQYICNIYIIYNISIHTYIFFTYMYLCSWLEQSYMQLQLRKVSPNLAEFPRLSSQWS